MTRDNKDIGNSNDSKATLVKLYNWYSSKPFHGNNSMVLSGDVNLGERQVHYDFDKVIGIEEVTPEMRYVKVSTLVDFNEGVELFRNILDKEDNKPGVYVGFGSSYVPKQGFSDGCGGFNPGTDPVDVGNIMPEFGFVKGPNCLLSIDFNGSMEGMGKLADNAWIPSNVPGYQGPECTRPLQPQMLMTVSDVYSMTLTSMSDGRFSLSYRNAGDTNLNINRLESIDEVLYR